MHNTSLYKHIREKIPGLLLLENEPMNAHCSFRIGGSADIYAEPSSETELAELLALLKENAVPWLIMGKGTNMLISDEGIRGAVIRLGERMGGMEEENGLITAGAGVSLARLAVFAQQRELTGLEFAHGIPGSLGGAVVMNAGAYGGEMKDIAVSVSCLDSDGNVLCHEGAANDFSYRRSRYTDSGEIVLSAKLRLEKGNGEAIAERMRELMEKRSASQPLDKASAGSTFKRPAVGYAAAMIDGAGLKGYRVGNAQVSEKHAGFVVNLGGASFSDVCRVMEHVQKTVMYKYGVELEPEVRIIR